MSNPQNWRFLTPLILTFLTVICSTFGFFTQRTLNQIDAKTDQSSAAISQIRDGFSSYQISSAERFKAVEKDVSYLTDRVKTIEIRAFVPNAKQGG